MAPGRGRVYRLEGEKLGEISCRTGESESKHIENDLKDTHESAFWTF